MAKTLNVNTGNYKVKSTVGRLHLTQVAQQVMLLLW